MHYPVDRDLSHGQHYPPFEQLGPDLKISGEYIREVTLCFKQEAWSVEKKPFTAEQWEE